jgi:hypothetical protein
MALRQPNLSDSKTPNLLTAEDAAAIARCSVATVRRAYRTGTLTAYRRRGSRAVLLDPQDVVAWTRGELVTPNISPTSQTAIRSRAGTTAPTTRSAARAVTVSRAPRFDLSVDAMRQRRNINRDTHA